MDYHNMEDLRFDFAVPGRAESYSPLALAYIGDAVFELYVRTALMGLGNMQANKLNKMARMYVKAESQAKMYHALLDKLTERELEILKRGRNASPHTTAKNASVNDYRHATAVEALFGYLYLNGEAKRLAEIFAICTEDTVPGGALNREH